MKPRRKRLIALIAVVGLLLLASSCSDSDSEVPADPEPTTSPPAALHLVVIGDSIPYNSSMDCPGCTGFVDRYADALTKATSRDVETSNLSQHTGLTLPMLLDELEVSYKEPLSDADAIIVGIAHNSFELNSEKPCGSTFDEATSTLTDWSKVTAECATSSAAKHRPLFDELFATIADWREGQPTLLRTINRYNDWNGWEEANLTPDQVQRTVVMHDAWNEMLCKSAKKHGFACADISEAFNGAHGTKPSGDMLAADYTHPSDKGNARIAEVLTSLGFDPLA
jgi:lysophospholipase L1-like esterase